MIQDKELQRIVFRYHGTNQHEDVNSRIFKATNEDKSELESCVS